MDLEMSLQLILRIPPHPHCLSALALRKHSSIAGPPTPVNKSAFFPSTYSPNTGSTQSCSIRALTFSTGACNNNNGPAELTVEGRHSTVQRGRSDSSAVSRSATTAAAGGIQPAKGAAPHRVELAPVHVLVKHLLNGTLKASALAPLLGVHFQKHRARFF